MSSTDWLVTVFFAGICMLALLGLPKLWRHETTYWDGRPPGWWVWGETLYRCWVRGLVVGTATSVLLLLTFLLGTLTGIDDPNRARGVADIAFGTAVFLLAISFLLVVTVAFFNWPKMVVPPHLRRERGAVADWRRKRRRRNTV